jgi:hypothetical protein
MIKKILAALALGGAFASAQAGILLQQGFDNVGGLGPGWVMNNVNYQAGVIAPNWFQVSAATIAAEHLFTSHSGADTSYIAADFENGTLGNGSDTGTLNNWLITPTFSTESAVSISLWIRGDFDQGYFDNVLFNFSGGGSAIGDFHTIGSMNPVPTDAWHQFIVTVGAQGAGTTGRFAIQYTGNVADANFIGIDDLLIQTAADPNPDPDPNPSNVPEPATMLLMATGLMGLAGARRRRG